MVSYIFPQFSVKIFSSTFLLNKPGWCVHAKALCHFFFTYYVLIILGKVKFLENAGIFQAGSSFKNWGRFDYESC